MSSVEGEGVVTSVEAVAEFDFPGDDMMGNTSNIADRREVEVLGEGVVKGAGDNKSVYVGVIIRLVIY